MKWIQVKDALINLENVSLIEKHIEGEEIIEYMLFIYAAELIIIPFKTKEELYKAFNTIKEEVNNYGRKTASCPA